MLQLILILSFFQDTAKVDTINRTIVYQSTAQATQVKVDELDIKLDLLLKYIEEKRPGVIIPKK